MRKIQGTRAVRVSLNDGLIVLDLNPSNTVTLAQLRTVLKNNGFVSKEARLEAAGTVAADDQALVFTVSGSGERFALLPSGNARTAYEGLKERLQAGPVTVEL